MRKQLFYESGVKALLRKLTLRVPLRPGALRFAGDASMRCQDAIQSLSLCFSPLVSAGSVVLALAELGGDACLQGRGQRAPVPIPRVGVHSGLRLCVLQVVVPRGLSRLGAHVAFRLLRRRGSSCSLLLGWHRLRSVSRRCRA